VGVDRPVPHTQHHPKGRSTRSRNAVCPLPFVPVFNSVKRSIEVICACLLFLAQRTGGPFFCFFVVLLLAWVSCPKGCSSVAQKTLSTLLGYVVLQRSVSAMGPSPGWYLFFICRQPTTEQVPGFHGHDFGRKGWMNAQALKIKYSQSKLRLYFWVLCYFRPFYFQQAQKDPFFGDVVFTCLSYALRQPAG